MGKLGALMWIELKHAKNENICCWKYSICGVVEQHMYWVGFDPDLAKLALPKSDTMNKKLY